MTLYLKYRPKAIEELDITEAREALTKIIKSGKIPHAFLFSGPKGTGKTSAARILAKIVNCEKRSTREIEPCNKCEECLSITNGNNIDVIELDAASHRGIDDARMLRDAVKLAPARAKKKVYIIDEAHMLTPEASNALLKTLEEPPEHVMFVLATTNPEKLIETIRSRAVNVFFNRATEEEVVRSLNRVVKGEKIKIDKESLTAIAEASRGSFRDGVKILEQLVNRGVKLDKDSVGEFLFKTKTFDVETFIKLLAQKKAAQAIAEIEEMVKKGGGVGDLLEMVLSRLRAGLLAKVGVGSRDLGDFKKSELIHLIELFSRAASELKSTPIEQLPVEIAIVKWCEGINGMPAQTAHLNLNSPSDKIGTDPARSHSPSSPSEPPRLDSTSQGLAQTQGSGVRGQTPTPAKMEGGEISEEIWRMILAKVKPINTSIEALLRAAKPIAYDGKSLTLGVYYRFHKERLEDGQHRRVLEDVVAAVLGAPVRVVCQLTQPPAKAAPNSPATPEKTVLTEGEDKDIIKIAEEIFGN